MEAVLDFYAQPADPQKPRLCFDERPCQLVSDVLAPLPVQPGKVAKEDNEDNEYVRNGTAVVLLAYDGTGHPAGQWSTLCRSAPTTYEAGLRRIYAASAFTTLPPRSTDSCAAG